MANKAKASLKSATGLTAARKAALAPVRNAAFTSGKSGHAVDAAVKAALGRSPIKALYKAVRDELVIGFMAAALVNKGDNREDSVLLDDCRLKIGATYAGFGGKKKLGKGQVGRRTKPEEAAYLSARVSTSGVMRRAEVSVKGSESRGGDTSKTRNGRKPRPGSNQKEPANDAQKTSPRLDSKAALLSYLNLQGAAMLATINRNAKLAPIEAKSAVQELVAALKKIEA